MSPARAASGRKGRAAPQAKKAGGKERRKATPESASPAAKAPTDRPGTRDNAARSDARHRRDLLAAMMRIRRFEERCVELYSAAKIRGFVHLYIGEEAVAVGVTAALDPEDAVVSTYREHGHALARGVPAEAIMAEMYGKATGCSRGRGGSMHLFDASRRFYGGSAIVGGGLPLAAGLALADRMRELPHVTCCFFGDGAFAEGEFHETANLAALWHLPLLLVCENNLYAMGTALAREHAQTDLAMRAASYGMPAWAVDGMDVRAVEDAARRAVTGIRAGNGPHFLEARTYRFRAHSMYDPDRYRDKEEIAEWKARDPVPALQERMRKAAELDDSALAELEDTIAAEVERAVEAAEQAPAERPEDLLRFVTSPPRTRS
ncbi:pyruvate dehydrogenase (acetyl-transferring) E1 component subunit alpha [Streptomyces sp. NPDC088124]|uniref:pyruvate dehydrogenase (acetyl-transferring) E1 component subunit alpha n=1 Tax=Streptomyces sp. NPDC088124 TaxID=3154654 RepID=UPI00344AF5E3